MPTFIQIAKIPKLLQAHIQGGDLAAKKGCNRCHSRGVTGYEPNPDPKAPRGSGRPILCRCVMVDEEVLMVRKAAADKAPLVKP